MSDSKAAQCKCASSRQVATGDRAILPEGAKTIPIYVMGKRYEVPETLTIMKAMEFAGFKFLRGCGCRGGICGACPTVYRKEGDYKLYFGLACQTVVEPNMYLAQIPFYPTGRSTISKQSSLRPKRSTLSTPSFSAASPVTTAPRPAPWESRFWTTYRPSSKET